MAYNNNWETSNELGLGKYVLKRKYKHMKHKIEKLIN